MNLVREYIRFERHQQPKEAMQIGIGDINHLRVGNILQCKKDVMVDKYQSYLRPYKEEEKDCNKILQGAYLVICKIDAPRPLDPPDATTYYHYVEFTDFNDALDIQNYLKLSYPQITYGFECRLEILKRYFKLVA